MKHKRIKKTIAGALAVASVMTINPMSAHADWKRDNYGWWYSEGDSWSNGWRYIGGQWYYFDPNGYMKTGWALPGDAWYYLDSNGVMRTGWVLDNGNWYYLNGSGAMKSGWVLDNGNWYYCDGSGAMKTGWILDRGNWYYCNGSGAMKTGWIFNGGKWYYTDNSGAMKTGWILDNGNWYYCNSSGEMQTGIIKVDDKVYSLNESGAMQVGTVPINGQVYTFAASGEAIGDNIPVCINEFDKYGNKKGNIVQDSKPNSSVENTDTEIDNNKTTNDDNSSSKGSSSSGSSSHHGSSGGSSHGGSGSNRNETFKVKFHRYEGTDYSSIKTITVNKNATIKQLPDYKYADDDDEDAGAYELKGWYINDETQLTTDTPITSNLDVYPKWYAINGAKKNDVIDKIHLDVQLPAIGNTPKNAVVSSDAPYKVIATRWFSGETYPTNEMDADDVFKKENNYEVKIMLMADEGYQFYTEGLWFMGAYGPKVYMNGQPRDIDNGDTISGAKFRELHFHYNNLYTKPDVIDDKAELLSDIDFSLWKDEGFSDYFRIYMTIDYDKETLEEKGGQTGIEDVNNNGLGQAIFEYNLENFYAFHHMNEYKLVDNNGKIDLVRKYNQPITILYDKDTLEIKNMKKGVNSIWTMIEDNKDSIRSKCDILVISALDYAADKSDILNNPDKYELVKDGDNIKFQLKKLIDTSNNTTDDNSKNDSNNTFVDLLKPGTTTPSAVTVK